MAGSRETFINRASELIRTAWSGSLLRYLTASGLTAMLYFGLMIALRELAGLSPGLALTIAYLVGLVIHFFATKLFTFRSYAARRTPREALAYGGLELLNYLIALGLARISIWFFATMYPGALAAPLIAFLINYPILKLRVFRSENPDVQRKSRELDAPGLQSDPSAVRRD